jgi:hypothetical protein
LLKKGSIPAANDFTSRCVSAAFGNYHCRTLLIFQSKEASTDGFLIVCEIADQVHVDEVVRRRIEEGLKEIEHSRSKQVFLDENVPLLIEVNVSGSSTQHRFAFLAASDVNYMTLTMAITGDLKFSCGGGNIHEAHVELPR